MNEDEVVEALLTKGDDEDEELEAPIPEKSRERVREAPEGKKEPCCAEAACGVVQPSAAHKGDGKEDSSSRVPFCYIGAPDPEERRQNSPLR